MTGGEDRLESSGAEQSPEDVTRPVPAPEVAGVAWGLVAILVGLALVVVFTVQNTGAVPIRFLWLEGRFSLAIVVLVTVALTTLVAEIAGLLYRRRRRRRIAEREELRRLRRES